MGQDRTDDQFLAQGIVMAISSTFSIIGSSLIIFMVRRDLSLVYHRILVMLSVGDIVISLFNGMHPFFVPADRTDSPIAHGNSATCAAFGFSLNAGPIYVSAYNAFLATNFFLQIRHKWTNKQIAEKIEPFVHVFAFVAVMTIPVIAIFQNKYALNYMTGYCLMGTYSEECEEVIVPIEPIDGVDSANDVNMLASSFNTTMNSGDPSATTMTVLECKPAPLGFGALALTVACTVGFLGSIGVASTVGLYRAVYSTYAANEKHATASQPSTASNNEEGRRRQPKRRSALSPQQEDRLKQVTWQCIMYGIVYCNTFVWPFAFGVVDWTMDMQDRLGHPGIFTLVMVCSLFYPAQGFFNFGVFIWPKYRKTRKTAERKLRQLIAEQRSSQFKSASSGNGQGNTMTSPTDAQMQSDRNVAAAGKGVASSSPDEPSSSVSPNTHVSSNGSSTIDPDTSNINPLQILYWAIHEVDPSRMTFSQQSFPSLLSDNGSSAQRPRSTRRMMRIGNRGVAIANRSSLMNATSIQESHDGGGETDGMPSQSNLTRANDDDGSNDGGNDDGEIIRSGLTEGMQAGQTLRQLSPKTEAAATLSDIKHKAVDHTGAVK